MSAEKGEAMSDEPMEIKRCPFCGGEAKLSHWGKYVQHETGYCGVFRGALIPREQWNTRATVTPQEAAKVLLAENIEGSLAKSMAHFVSVKEWEGYQRGVKAYTERLRAISEDSHE